MSRRSKAARPYGYGAYCCRFGKTDRGLPPFERDHSKPHLVYFCYPRDCGIGESALAYQDILRKLGYDVEVRTWRAEWGDIQGEPETTYFHHWHPQPGGQAPPDGMPGLRHIAYWAYENQGYFPREWQFALPVMDEIWCPSEFCHKIFSPHHSKVRVVPHVVEEPEQEWVRRPFTVTFLYDAWSHACRKNPDAAIRVFRRTFVGNTDARMVIKTHHCPDDEMAWLKYMVKDDKRIRIVNKFLPDAELDQLWRETSCLLSLQRSEGFGLNIAKAIARGIPTVTTGWGGHMDFARGIVWAVRYDIEDAGALGNHWYGNGRWAQPNEDHAVAQLADVYQLKNRGKLDRGITRMRQKYSEEHIGNLIGGLLG